MGPGLGRNVVNNMLMLGSDRMPITCKSTIGTNPRHGVDWCITEVGRGWGAEEGMMKDEVKRSIKRRRRRETEGSSLGWPWPALHNTDIQTNTKRDSDTHFFLCTIIVKL